MYRTYYLGTIEPPSHHFIAKFQDQVRFQDTLADAWAQVVNTTTERRTSRPLPVSPRTDIDPVIIFRVIPFWEMEVNSNLSNIDLYKVREENRFYCR